MKSDLFSGFHWGNQLRHFYTRSGDRTKLCSMPDPDPAYAVHSSKYKTRPVAKRGLFVNVHTAEAYMVAKGFLIHPGHRW